MTCPRCKSPEVIRERSPDGHTICKACRLNLKHADWDAQVRKTEETTFAVLNRITKTHTGFELRQSKEVREHWDKRFNELIAQIPPEQLPTVVTPIPLSESDSVAALAADIVRLRSALAFYATGIGGNGEVAREALYGEIPNADV